MQTTAHPRAYSGIHPLHAVLLAGMLPLFLGAALSDYAYFTSYHIQWGTFASWMIAGGLVFNGFAILAALIGVFRAERGKGLSLVYLAVLVVSWVLGFINALVHAKDAWAMMPAGLMLSIVVVVLTLVALFLGFTRTRAAGVAS
ncbi:MULTISPECIES: DUF2231 domain-containing protein [unclassified Halomonas]|uniref:DUF2231 domain-containing protein n=1 Tax=unclassified Halomonas TaxID=2609666 RepID=UPI0020769C14|nr:MULTISPECIES: DUF2231 domain-containing protein [unclassified Halomonas]